MKKIQISPSILSADFSQLGNEIKKLEEGGADMIHVDVMDGHFVPNLTIGPPVIKALKKNCSIKFDVHLMISPVHKYIEAYSDAGADIITIHPEATDDLEKSILKIKSLNKKVGVSLNPESKIDLDILQEKIDYRDDLDPIVNKWTEKYASTDEMFVEQEWAKVPDTNKIATRGIEVGHIFYFGTKYSEPLGLKVADKDGSLKPLHMGSYGIGVSRVFAGIIEACHDEKGIVFPSSVAPFDVGLVNVSVKDENCTKTCDEYYETLQNNDIEVAYDDRDIGAGAKFSDMELIGLPWVIVVGKKSIEKGLVELKNRTTGQTQDLSFEQAINIVKGK